AVAGGSLGAAVLAAGSERRVRLAALIVAVGALAAAPASWAAQTLGHATNGTFPAGGPAGAGGFGGGPGNLRGGAIPPGGFRGGFGSGPGGDTRVGSRTAMAAVAAACTAVTAAGTTGGTLYDCRGKAGALAAAG